MGSFISYQVFEAELTTDPNVPCLTLLGLIFRCLLAVWLINLQYEGTVTKKDLQCRHSKF